MKTKLVCTRKYNKKEYKFFLNEPEYEYEKGVCGAYIEPYVSVETPQNGFGYSDIILISNSDGMAYTQYRYLPHWILKKIQEKMIQIMDKYYC